MKAATAEVGESPEEARRKIDQLQEQQQQLLAQLRREPAPLREIATWPGFDADRAARLLNGLYLHAALIVTRSHPGAISSH